MPQPHSNLSLPESDAEHAALPRVKGQPQPGDLVAYKLLEIGADWAPQVSEWRQGEIAEVKGESVVIKPLPGQDSLEQPSSQANGHAQQEEDFEAEEEEDDEGPPSAYDDDGVLTTDLSALSELRLIQSSPNTAKTPHVNTFSTQNTSGKANGISEAQTDKIVSPHLKATATETASQPDVQPHASTAVVPDSAKTTKASTPVQAEQVTVSEGEKGKGADAALQPVPVTGPWAQLQEQIAKRKAELAGSSGSAAAQSSTAHSTEPAQQQQQQQKGSNLGKGLKAVAGMNVPGAVRPRGGVRASAMGPMLAFLRSSGGLQ